MTEERQPLKLRARDSEDITVIASCLQDALIPMEDVAFVPGEKRFVFVANRFCWEHPDTDAAQDLFHRVNSGVTFEGVSGVKSRGVDLSAAHAILELLTMELDEGAVMLVFAGGGEIRLTIGEVDCHMQDIGEPWPTRSRPEHPEPEPNG